MTRGRDRLGRSEYTGTSWSEVSRQTQHVRTQTLGISYKEDSVSRPGPLQPSGYVPTMPEPPNTELTHPTYGFRNPSQFSGYSQRLPPPSSAEVWPLCAPRFAPSNSYNPPSMVLEPNEFPVSPYVPSIDAFGSRIEQNHVNPSYSSSQLNPQALGFEPAIPVSSHSEHHPRSELPIYISKDGPKAVAQGERLDR